MNIRNLLIGLGVLGLLVIAAERAMSRIGHLEERNAQLEQQMALMAQRLEIDAAVLSHWESARGQAEARADEDAKLLGKGARAAQTSGDSWADSPLPDYVVGVFGKTEADSIRDSKLTAGQSVHPGAGASAYRVD